MNYLPIAIFSAIVILNIYATYKILNGYIFTKQQKIIQIAIVWCVPVIAALGSLYFVKEPMKHIKKKKSGFTEEGHCGGSVHGGDD